VSKTENENTEREMNHTHYIGIACGWESAAKFVMEEAVEEFRRDKPFSHCLKDLSKKLSCKASEAQNYAAQFEAKKAT